METKDYFSYVVNEIHSTIVATVDDEGLPVTCAIGMMDIPAVITQEHCRHCGNCVSVCPTGTVIKR